MGKKNKKKKTESTSSTSYDEIESGFLYKPQSDSGGLVILMPSRHRGSQVSLIGPDGTVIEQGRSTGYANGDREHFRFSQDGGNYPAGTVVQMTLSDGSVMRYKIEDTSMRVESGGASSGEGSSSSGAGAIAAINSVGSNLGAAQTSIRDNISAVDDQNYLYESPLSTLETIQAVSDIVIGSTKSYADMQESLKESAKSTAESILQIDNTKLTAIPGYNTEE